MKSEQAVRLVAKVNKETQDGVLQWSLYKNEGDFDHPSDGPTFSAISHDGILRFYLYKPKLSFSAPISDFRMITAEILVVEDKNSGTSEKLSGYKVISDLYQIVRGICFPLDKSIQQYLSAS